MRAIQAIALLVCFAHAALASNTILGLVRNQSRGHPAVGDEVILVRLDRGMEEEARTKTDAQGAFALTSRRVKIGPIKIPTQCYVGEMGKSMKAGPFAGLRRTVGDKSPLHSEPLLMSEEVAQAYANA